MPVGGSAATAPRTPCSTCPPVSNARDVCFWAKHESIRTPSAREQQCLHHQASLADPSHRSPCLKVLVQAGRFRGLKGHLSPYIYAFNQQCSIPLRWGACRSTTLSSMHKTCSYIPAGVEGLQEWNELHSASFWMTLPVLLFRTIHSADGAEDLRYQSRVNHLRCTTYAQGMGVLRMRRQAHISPSSLFMRLSASTIIFSALAARHMPMRHY